MGAPRGTRPLPERTTKLATSGAFAALAVGELLDDRRYEIVSVLAETPTLNTYLARDRQQRYCPRCNSPQGIDHSYCEKCGEPLDGATDEHPLYRLKEAADAQMLERERVALALSLDQTGLTPVHRFFQWAPYAAQPRTYVLLPVETGQALASMPTPQPPRRVLAWARQVAEILADLQQKGYRCPDLQLDQMRQQDGRMVLAENVRLEPTAQAQAIGHDIGSFMAALQALLPDPPPQASVASLFASAIAGRHPTFQALIAAIDGALADLEDAAPVRRRAGWLSDVGRVRELDEDSLLCLEMVRVHESVEQSLALYAIADGMGGHAAGEIASRLALAALARSLVDALTRSPQPSRPDYGGQLRRACEEANQAVVRESRRRRSDLGTTLVAALLVGRRAYVANVGDSRAYHLDRDRIEQISVDHSLVERLVSVGKISREEARNHPQANLIYRTLGDKPGVQVDLFERCLAPGDRLLLCCDGLTGLVGDDEIHQVVLANPDPQAACVELVRRANAAGGHDNITVILVACEEIT